MYAFIPSEEKKRKYREKKQQQNYTRIVHVHDFLSVKLTFPSMASFAFLASSSFIKYTKPKPLDLPVSLSYNILTKNKHLNDLAHYCLFTGKLLPS